MLLPLLVAPAAAQAQFTGNNYAPVSIGPDGAAYVGVLSGLVLVRDKSAPPAAETRPKLRVKARRRGARARVGRRTKLTNGRGRATLRSKGRRAVAKKPGYRRDRAKVKR